MRKGIVVIIVVGVVVSIVAIFAPEQLPALFEAFGSMR